MSKVDGKQLSQLIRVSDKDTLSETQAGVWVATCTFKCDWKQVFRLMPQRNVAKHPDFNFLKCTSSTVTRDKGGVAVVTATYEGGSPSSPSSSGANSAILDVSSTATEEPIETHPRFEEMAGTPDAELWPGVFEDGKFAGFPKDDNSGGDCPFFGVTSYLAPRTVVTRTTQSTTAPASTRVGFLDTPPTGGGTFLKIEHSYTKNGGTFTIVESWLGPADGKSWDTTIYS